MTNAPHGEPVASGVPGVAEEDVTVTRDGLRLHGVLARPEGDGPERVVVTVHGWGGTAAGPHRLFVRLGRELAGAGCAALRFDLAGRGFSDGDAATARLDDMIADTVAAADLLRERFGAERVDAVGLCSGGNVVLGAATLRPDAFDRLVCLSTLPFAPQPASRGWKKAFGYLRQYARKALSPRTWARLFRGEVDVRGVGKVVGDAVSEDAEGRRLKDSARDIMGDLAAWRRPVLFLWGGGDPEAADARACYEPFATAHGVPAVFDAVPEANHNFYSVGWAADARARTVRFLTEKDAT